MAGYGVHHINAFRCKAVYVWGQSVFAAGISAGITSELIGEDIDKVGPAFVHPRRPPAIMMNTYVSYIRYKAYIRIIANYS